MQLRWILSALVWLQQLTCTVSKFEGLKGSVEEVKMEGTEFRYVIKFVSDMNNAVKFYRDTLGLALRFESPGWSEFATGETTLALHPASDVNPAGKVEFGFTVADVKPSIGT